MARLEAAQLHKIQEGRGLDSGLVKLIVYKRAQEEIIKSILKQIPRSPGKGAGQQATNSLYVVGLEREAGDRLEHQDLGMDKPEKYQRQRAKKRIYVDSNHGGPPSVPHLPTSLCLHPLTPHPSPLPRAQGRSSALAVTRLPSTIDARWTYT